MDGFLFSEEKGVFPIFRGKEGQGWRGDLEKRRKAKLMIGYKVNKYINKLKIFQVTT